MSVYSNKKHQMTINVFIGLLLGLVVGYLCFSHVSSGETKENLITFFSIITSVFLRLIQMIIAPLILSTLIVGIAKIGEMHSIGRISAKTLIIFLFSSVLSLTIGLIMVNFFHPGDGLNYLTKSLKSSPSQALNSLSFKDFIVHSIPQSIIEGMATNHILQVVIFALFFGIALASLGEKANKLINILEIISDTMFVITSYVMKLAPFAIFASIASTITLNGLEIIGVYGRFVSEFYISSLIICIFLIIAGCFAVKSRIFELVERISEPALIAFTTTSSEAAFPKSLDQLEKFGVSNKTASLVLPLGYSFNLVGSMMYCAFATIFIAQAYGIEISITQQFILLGILMITSKGVAGVPRSSLVVIAATLGQFNLPKEGILLLFAVDHFMDMARSAINVIGNCIASVIVAKWEGEDCLPLEQTK